MLKASTHYKLCTAYEKICDVIDDVSSALRGLPNAALAFRPHGVHAAQELLAVSPRLDAGDLGGILLCLEVRGEVA